MADQLRDVLTRVADRAGPVSVDPLLWSRAARTRRRRQAFTAAAAVLVVVALLGGIVLATGVLRHRPAACPTDRTDRDAPIEIEGIAGDGGLRIEKDLAIGRASVAIAERHGCLRRHRGRRRPPSDRPPRLRRTPVRRDGRRGRVSCAARLLSLSPDGTKLIYAWHEPFVRRCDGSVEPGEGWVAERCPAAGSDHRHHRHLPVRTG